MGFQGQSSSAAMVLSFYLEYSQDEKIWDKHGYLPPVPYTVRILSRLENFNLEYFFGLKSLRKRMISENYMQWSVNL